MSDVLALFLRQCRFFIEIALLCVMYALPLERRERFPLRLVLGAAVGILIAGLVPSGDIFLFIESLLLAAGLVMLCWRVPFPDGLYCAACAYATQHFAYAAYSLVYQLQERSPYPPMAVTVEWVLVCGSIYVLFYWLFARHLADGKRYYVDGTQSIFSTVMLLAVVLVLSSATGHAYVLEGNTLYVICRMYSMFCCVFFLGMQVSRVKQHRLQEELAFQQQLSRQQKEQYELSRETIDLINRKCHDLKHQVSALRVCVPENQRERYLTEIDRCVRIYDSAAKTGSEVLDTVLTEKSLYCEAHQITITCMADGSRLSFLDPIDLYTIFGNAIDNAVESVCQEEDPEKRIITVSAVARSGLVILEFENYCARDLEFQGDLPRTTKSQRTGKEMEMDHGFGLRSIRYTVEKYGGCMTIHQENQMFTLRISIPVPAEAVVA